MTNILWAIVQLDGGVQSLRRTDENGDVSWVPEAPGNRHYGEYLAWVAEGNTAEVIEEEA